MAYKVLGKSLYDVPEEEREARDERLTMYLIDHMRDREVALKTDTWGYISITISDGGDVWYDLEDAIERLAIKDGCDLVRYDDGTLGLVAYYNGRKSYLQIITDEKDVAFIKDTLREEDEEE